MILISPSFLITKLVSNFVLFLTTPYYKKIANNSVLTGKIGADAKPGLHGFDGGRLLILTENKLKTTSLLLLTNLISKSSERQGGPEQNGI